MPFDTTILSGKIDKIKEAYLNGRFGDALVGALNTANGQMQQRVFQTNVDVDGQTFGEYIGEKTVVSRIISRNKTKDRRNKKVAGLSLTGYQRKRARAGRQISHKDLEFYGSLRRSIETQIENENAAVLEFNNTLAAKIARGQENQIENIRRGKKGYTKGNGTRIFRLNQSEKDQVVEQGAELIKQILKPK